MRPTSRFDRAGAEERARFGQRVQAKRKKLGWTQPMLFERTGVAVSHISGIERGEVNPSLEVMVILARVLDEELSDLLKP